MKRTLLIGLVAMVLTMTGCKSQEIAQIQNKVDIKTEESEAVIEDIEEEEAIEEKEEKIEEEVVEKRVSREYLSALTKSELYAEGLHMSKEAIYCKLISKHGVTEDAAKYAVENIDINWNKNALKKAKMYANDTGMSEESIYDQIVSEDGEKFTKEEAQYAVDNL